MNDQIGVEWHVCPSRRCTSSHIEYDYETNKFEQTWTANILQNSQSRVHKPI